MGDRRGGREIEWREEDGAREERGWREREI